MRHGFAGCSCGELGRQAAPAHPLFPAPPCLSLPSLPLPASTKTQGMTPPQSSPIIRLYGNALLPAGPGPPDPLRGQLQALPPRRPRRRRRLPCRQPRHRLPPLRRAAPLPPLRGLSWLPPPADRRPAVHPHLPPPQPTLTTPALAPPRPPRPPRNPRDLCVKAVAFAVACSTLRNSAPFAPSASGPLLLPLPVFSTLYTPPSTR